MNAEIISIGTEILLGEILDSNSAYLSQVLAKLGINVFHETTVGDNEKNILEALNEGSKRSDLVITIGGLGPTEDDLTKPTLAKFLDEELVYDNDGLTKLDEFFKRSKRIQTENNKRQAWVLSNSNTIKNDNGLALGIFYQGESTDYIVLPGPPSEFKPMVDSKVIPLLTKQYQLKNTIQSQTLHFVGIGESALATKVDDLIQSQTNPTLALYFKPTDVTIRITAKADNEQAANILLDDMKAKILDRVGDFYYATGDQVTLPDFVVNQLKDQKLTITAAESLTAGAFQSTIAQTPGASDIYFGGFITYANDIKTKLVGVDPRIIDEHTVVSAPVAKAMAQGALKTMETDFALGFTGMAGPGELEGHPAGEVFIGLAKKDGTVIAKQFQLSGNRQKIRNLAVMRGFQMVLNELKK